MGYILPVTGVIDPSGVDHRQQTIAREEGSPEALRCSKGWRGRDNGVRLLTHAHHHTERLDDRAEGQAPAGFLTLTCFVNGNQP